MYELRVKGSSFTFAVMEVRGIYIDAWFSMPYLAKHMPLKIPEISMLREEPCKCCQAMVCCLVNKKTSAFLIKSLLLTEIWWSSWKLIFHFHFYGNGVGCIMKFCNFSKSSYLFLTIYLISSFLLGFLFFSHWSSLGWCRSF